MGKGDKYRQINKKKFDKNYDMIFRKKKKAKKRLTDYNSRDKLLH